MKRFKRLGWIAGYLCAAVLLVLFFRTIDFTALRAFTTRFWARGVGGVVAFQLLIIAFHSFQWGLLLSYAGIRVRIPRLYGARLAGAAVSILSPSLSIGGEVVRAALVKGPAISASRLTATVAVDKYVELATRMPFVIAGLIILMRRLPGLNPLFLEAGLAFAVAVLAATALAVVLFRRASQSRSTERQAGFFARLLNRARPGAVDRLRGSMEGFVSGMTAIRPKRLLPVFATGLLTAGTELLQILFVLSLLGLRGASGAVAVQSASILGGIVGVLPANIGGMEAANMLSITLLGGSTATALAYSLIIRGGQAGTVLCGLIYLALRRFRNHEAAASQRQCCSSE